MKRKNLVIGIVASVFAFGSAFVSPKLAPETIWLKVQYSYTTPFVCEATRTQCEQMGDYPCWVNTPLQAGFTTVLGKRGTSCVEVLKSTYTSPYFTIMASGKIPVSVQP